MTAILLRYPSGPILRSIEELENPPPPSEVLWHVPDARVVLAEYDVLQNDFVELKTDNLIKVNPSIADLPVEAQLDAVQAIIDCWLIDNAAFISTPQARQAIVNTPVHTVGYTTIGFRPPLYGRAVVVSIRNNSELPSSAWKWMTSDGLLDLKGAGVAPGRVPSHARHSDGLEYLGVALGDYLLRRAVDEIFRRAAPALWTVPVYAVLDLGFDIRDGWRGTAPAGMHVRRAHRRPPGGMMLPETGSAEESAKFETEMLLRSYGLTSTNGGSSLIIENNNGRITVYSNREPLKDLSAQEVKLLLDLTSNAPRARFDRVNVQMALGSDACQDRGQLVDFGHINAVKHFTYPVCSAVRDRPFCLGGMIRPDHPAFVQPDPVLRLPFDTWNRDTVNELSFDLSAKWRRNEISREDVRLLLEQPLRSVLCEWPDD